MKKILLFAMAGLCAMAAQAATDQLSFKTVQLGSFTEPAFTVGDQPKLKCTLQNSGTNIVVSYDYEIRLDGETIVEKHVSPLVMVGGSSVVNYTLRDLTAGRHEVQFVLLKVNDVECELSYSIPFYCLNEGEGYPRAFVVEEGTGTWCGYCPAGIVGMEYMQEKYPDFCGIAVHASDEFSTASYNGIFNYLGDGVPSCIVNRDPRSVPYPADSELEAAYVKWQSNPATAKVEIADCVVGENGIELTTATTFLFDNDNANYRLAYAVTEDGLTGAQSNSYSGSSNAPGNWGSKASYVNWTYTHTARAIYSFDGVANSVPAQVKAGEEYLYTYTVPTSAIKVLDNSAITVMLINKDNGVIANAAKIYGSGYAGVQNVVEDSAEGEPEYYNLQGVRVENPGKGLYIRRCGKQTTKVLL